MKLFNILTNHTTYFYLLILFLPTQLARHFWPPWSAINGIRLDYLSPTIHLTDTLLLLTLLLWFLEILSSNFIQNSKFKIQNPPNGNNKKFLVILFLITFIALNITHSLSPSLTLYKWLKILEFAFLAIYISKTITPQKLFVVSGLLLVGASLESLIAVIQFLAQSSLGGPLYWLGERTFDSSTPGIAQAVVNGSLVLRPYGTLPHPNALAGYLLVVMILTTPSLFNKVKSRRLKFLLFAICCLLFTAIAISFSRSAYLAILFLIFLCFLKRSVAKLFGTESLLKKFNHFSFILGSALIFLGVSLFLINAPFSDPDSLVKRQILGNKALETLQKSPLFGIGPGNFPLALASDPTLFPVRLLQPVHNIYLLVLSETGLVGFLLFAETVIFAAKRLIFHHPDTRHQILSTRFMIHTSLFVILFIGFFDHYFVTLQQTQLLFAATLGLSLNNKL